MSDTFTVEREPRVVDASPERKRTIFNLYGGTVHYRNTAEAVETGEVIEVGDSVTTEERLWLVADGRLETVTVLVGDAE